MANGDSLPDTDRVVRGCARSGYADGEFTAAAFALREQELPHGQISADRVECPSADENKRTPEGSVERLKAVRVGGPYALLPVAEIRQIDHPILQLDVIEFGNERNRCHCAITGFAGTHEDLAVQIELAEITKPNARLFPLWGQRPKSPTLLRPQLPRAGSADGPCSSSVRT